MDAMPRLFVLLLLATSTLAAGGQPDASRPLRVLFIGNSLTAWNNLPSMVETLAQAGGHARPITRTIAFGGFSLEDHWQQGDARRAIASGASPGAAWDVVVLQQGPSALVESRRLLIQFAKQFADAARAVGAKPALYMVWPSTDRPQDFNGVSQSYRRAAEEVKGLLFPAGDAWRTMMQRNRRLKLYSDDGLHPTQAGSYLAALVIYEGLYDRSCVGLPPIGVSPDEAKALQEIVAEIGRRVGQVGLVGRVGRVGPEVAELKLRATYYSY